MYSEDMLKIYKRLFVLGLLSVGLIVFGLSSGAERVYAAGCSQDCEATYAMCIDFMCASECDGTSDEECNSCLNDCGSDLGRCMEHAIYCEEPTLNYTGQCQVDFTLHCPIPVNGTSGNCNLPGTHWGYTLTCSTLGGNYCTACPDHPSSECTGSNGNGSCY